MWYLLTDGTITQSTPAVENRVVGIWDAKYSTGTSAEQIALDEFAKNKFSHSIKFTCLREFNLYDSLQLRCHNTTILSEVTAIAKSPEIPGFVYTSGELRANFTDHLRELIL